MTAEEHKSPTWAVLRLRVTTDGDPSALPKLLSYLTNINVTPRSVSAEFGAAGLMYVAVDVCGLPEARVSLIAAKIAEAPCVLNAHWHHL
jgi:hypothetical protein